MAHPLYGPEIKDMLAQDDAAGLAALCEELHPATIADAIDDTLTVDETWQLLTSTEARTQAGIFEYLPEERQIELLSDPTRPQVVRLIEKMTHDDRVDLMQKLPAKLTESLLRLVDEADRRDIKMLVEYGGHTVGTIMTTDYAWLPPTLTAAEAVDQLRAQAPDRETIYYIYILDEVRKKQDGGLLPRKLLGILSLRDLILAPRHQLLRDLMSDELVALKYTDDRSVAAELLARYDFIAVPVLDETGGMLGIVTHDDALDVVKQEATEDLQRQAGVNPLSRGYLQSSFFQLWKSRAFWLSLLFVAELATFTVMTQFEDAIAAVVVLSLFIPLCISTGGNSGSQASTLITRAMALGEFGPKDWFRVLKREVLMGLALGLTLGVIALFRGALTPDDTRGGPTTFKQPIHVVMPKDGLTQNERGDYVLPKGTNLTSETKRDGTLRPPPNEKPEIEERPNGTISVTFPAETEMRSAPVGRWQLGAVIALSVLGICLWGTIVGACLPLVFRRVGLDPAIASGPFVATFVDITGIAIFFSIAKVILL